MESERIRNTLSEGSGDGLQTARPLHGRTSGPTRRSTKGQWTAEEDEILRMAVQRFKGKNWKKIAECFKDRTDVQCLHRWQKVLNPDLVKGPWSKEEDEVIIELVNKYGPKKWSTIAQHLPGRIGKQCRERWHNHLNPNINKEAWTQEEELALIRAHQIYGNKWAELTKFLPGRTDNAIKNHWNSSVKKKLDMYMASGLLSQYQGPPLVSQSTASSSSKAQQSSEENNDGAEVEEASGCSQGSILASISLPANNEIDRMDHHSEDCGTTEGSTSIPCSEDYRHPAFQKVIYAAPEAPCELDAKFVEHDFSLDWGTFAGKDWQVNTNELPDMSMQDLGQESSGVFIPSLTGRENHNAIPFPMETYMRLDGSISTVNMDVDSDTANLVTNADTKMVYPEVGHDGRSCENVICDVHEAEGQLVHNCPNYEMPYDMLGGSATQPTYVSTQLLPDDDSVLLSTYPDQYNYSSHVSGEQESSSPITVDGFVYANESNCSPREDKFDEAKRSPKLVPANDFVLEPLNDLQCCSPKDEESAEKDSGALFYEPPRFPSLDIPFFSCDLVQSGSDMHQEYSPLGIRQLMISSTTPFKLWDSPSRDDSPVAVLKSAAKSFTCTPSILRKRHRDLLSPLSEKRDEKKLRSSSKPESFSNLTNEISCLEVFVNECMEDQKGPNSKGDFIEKENVALVCEQSKNEGNESIFISGSRISQKDNNVSECSEKQTERSVAEEVKTNTMGKDVMDKAKESSGILVEHDMNDMLFFTPDHFGTKGGRTMGPSAKALGNQYTRRIESISKPGASSETSCFSVLCSPQLCTKKDVTSLQIATSIQSLSPSAKKVECFGKGMASENNVMYVETPFKRSIESPSAWKSPWFVNTFVPGPRVDTDITVEDIGYFLSPGDQSYDAIGLMKQLGEQTAGAFADAQEVLGDETPDSLFKGKCFTKHEGEKENDYTPNMQGEHHSVSASSLMTERRALDFSECATPGKENRKFSSSSVATPSSYLLRSCR
ncbi:hypothetical protein C2S52_008736 [Perilla frutescens var. hirtella]|nr:hypothetical protein C2S52_008736 [Perilla frutescens var. hirtella]